MRVIASQLNPGTVLNHHLDSLDHKWRVCVDGADVSHVWSFDTDEGWVECDQVDAEGLVVYLMGEDGNLWYVPAVHRGVVTAVRRGSE